MFEHKLKETYREPIFASFHIFRVTSPSPAHARTFYFYNFTTFISSNVTKRFCYEIFRTISIYIIYLGLQLDGTEIPSHSRVMFSIRTIKERKLRELLSFLWFFYSFLFPIFSLFYDRPPVISAVPSWPVSSALHVEKCSKLLEKCEREVSPWKPFGIFSRKSLLTSQVTTSFSRSVTHAEAESHIKRRSVKFPGLWNALSLKTRGCSERRWLRHWRNPRLYSEKAATCPEEAADCCTINYVSTKRIGSNLNRTEIVSNQKPIICCVFELLDKRLIGCFMIRESHCFCLFID